ncbi:tetratricopeptide repeat protein [Granulicella arctica]|uniref:hypothetical protein n=1 Tax=Granulicella arctica TaxID=940613 RepID=UPI0021E01EF6|nr:hypothetical protein [Granulicella arctica]
MQQKDYSGAVKQFSKITFGLRHDDAVHLMQEAKNAEGHPQLLAANKETLIAAQAAYDRGDLATAEANAKQVQVPELQSSVQQILTNIRIYQDAMQAGDAAKQNGNYQAAQQKYKFAMVIRPNGPGNPGGKLQEVEVLLAAATVNKPSTPPPTKPVVADTKKPVEIPKAPDNDAKIRAALAEGHAAESRKDVDAALQAFERVLAINPRQAEALAGKQHIMDNMQKTPQGLENTLSIGLHDYYRSQLAEAGDAISLYLTAGGVRNRGVAYFYLGATFASQALLADPRGKTEHKSLEQHALLEFQQARCEHYQPIEKYLSPKVLALWNKSSC